MAGLVMLVGAAMLLIATIQFLVEAFKEHVIWGLACLFFHPVCWFFLLAHWERARRPALLYLMGLGILAFGWLLHPHPMQ